MTSSSRNPSRNSPPSGPTVSEPSERSPSAAASSIHEVEVESSKLLDYLLDTQHPDGGSKAAFFLGFGFARAQPEVMAQALIEHAQGETLVKSYDVTWGRRFHVEGPLATPSGRRPYVRTVWQLDHGATAARFITARPLSRRGSRAG